MQGKELLDFLFHLYDYADDLADRIKPGEFDNVNYFMTLIFFEKYFDSIGRSEIHQAAEDANDPNINPHKELSEAHRRIDLLRKRIQNISQEYDFDQDLDRIGQRLAVEWRKDRS